MAEQQKQRTIILAVILALALAGALVYMRTSRTAPAPVPTPAPAVATPAPDAAPTAPPVTTREYTTAPNAPLTLTALRFMPEQTQVAIGIPPVSSLIERVAPFAQELLGDEMDVQAELDAISHDLAADMGVPDEGGLAGVLSAMGFDSDAGMAVFLDMEKALEQVLTAVSEDKLEVLPDMSTLKGVVTIPVRDAAQAAESLEKLTKDLLSGVIAAEETAGAVTITVYEELGAFFITDRALVAGSDLDMVRAAAARVEQPASLRYGSTSCPPDDAHEMAMLVFGERLLPVLEQSAELVKDLDASYQVLLQSQIARLKAIYANAGADDPMIISLNVTEEALELKSRFDTEVYPEALAYMGQARPLRWAQLLPENTMAFLSLCFSPEAKKQISDVYLEAIPDDVRNSPGVSQGLMYSQSALDLLGGEVTLGMTGFEPIDFPSIFLIIELSNSMAAQMLLQMAPQVNHDDPYRDVQIKMLGMPFPIHVFFALVGDALIISNSDGGIRAMIDMVKDDTTSGFFASLTPPIAPETPLYQALVLRPALYGDIVEPLLALSGQTLPAEYGGVAAALAALFEDIRFFNEMQDSWSVSRLYVSRVNRN